MRRLHTQFILGLTLFILPIIIFRLFWIRPGIAVLLLIWFVVVGYFLKRSFINPLRDLQRQAQKTSAEPFSLVIRVHDLSR